MRALPLGIYKSNLGDCSNGGISSRFREILLICDEGHIEIDENNPPENLCKLVVKDYGFTVYKHIEPVAKANGVGWMAGGTLVYTCDSRFRRMSEYPLVLHDRTESQKEYDALSK